MIRFVDLRPADITCNRFAFWNTITDSFDRICDRYAWDTWADFLGDVEFDKKHQGTEYDVKRYRALAPAWVDVKPEDAVCSVCKKSTDTLPLHAHVVVHDCEAPSGVMLAIQRLKEAADGAAQTKAMKNLKDLL